MSGVRKLPRPLALIGAEIGEGASDRGCKWGAQALRQAGLGSYLREAGLDARWADSVRAHRGPGVSRMQVVEQFSSDLAASVAQALQRGEKPVVIGGDHSCAVGTWSAAAQAVHGAGGDLGLIWVDAHLDAHTPQTSESLAPHGMPVAALLGEGADGLTALYGWKGKLKPDNLVIIGARSYEQGEQQLLARLGVRVMYMDEVIERGFQACFTEALAQVRRTSAAWGLSFDLDALDPSDAPGTGTPVEAGIALADAVHALQGCAQADDCMALELAEYNPSHDVDGRTASAAFELLGAALQPQPAPEGRSGHVIPPADVVRPAGWRYLGTADAAV